MTEELYDLIRIISVVSPVLPLVCLLVFWKNQPRQNRILAISILISLTFDITALILMRWFNPKSICISNNLYIIFSFPAIMWFYHETLTKKSFKALIRIFTLCFLVVAVIFANMQGLNVPNFYTMTLSSILIAATSFFFVADLNQMDESSFLKNRFHQTNIMLNSSLALYYFITIIMFALSDYVFSHTTHEDYHYFWASHNALNTLKNLGITVAFYLSAKYSFVLHNLQPSKTNASKI